MYNITNANILVCDDEKDIVSALKIYLAAEGYQVFEAFNGKEALEIIAAEEIHLVLMDIMMPVMDGLDATRAIRQMEREDCQTLPIVAMSANAFDDDLKKSVDCGMNGHLSKPVDADKLFKKLAEVIFNSTL